MPKQEDTTITVPHSSSAVAELNAPPEITLFHSSGKAIRVPEADEEFWLTQGFRRQVADVRAVAEELKATFPAALDAILLYVEGVTKDGHIDPADSAAQATAAYAMRKLEEQWGLLVTAIEMRYPMKQGKSVLMSNGVEQMEFDPNDVALYESKGWKKL
jgi:hypothetical protein